MTNSILECDLSNYSFIYKHSCHPGLVKRSGCVNLKELSLGGGGAGSRQVSGSRAARPVSPQTEDGVDIQWLGSQEARWAPTNLALGNFLRREKIGEQICWGYSLRGQSRNWCQFQGYGDFSETHDAPPMTPQSTDSPLLASHPAAGPGD